MSKQVFISYSSADRDIARQVCDYLEQGGLTCWIAPRDVVPSAEYAEQLIGAIESARLMLLILSDKSNTSPQVVREVERAVSNGMPILPFRIEDVQLTKSMEYFISSNHWLDACEGEVQNYYPDLLQAIQTTLTGSQRRLRGNGSQPRDEIIFTLEFHCDGSNVQVRSSEGMAHEQKTLKYYDNVTVSLESITRYADGIKDILSSASREGAADNHALDRLQQLGQLLYDELFPARTKENLNRTESRSLILGIDDQLVAIPWELIFDGREFLCQRFSMGRVVSTRQEIIGSQRQCGMPLKALLMADPQGNLPSAYSEGMKLRDLFDEHEDMIEASLASSNIAREYFRQHLRQYDLLHYAGHAFYNQEDPAKSGFLLSDGCLTAADIIALAGRKPFPSLVFSNACGSGQTEEWQIREGYQNVFGLANAFLKSGVRHYLGTFWDIQDEPGQLFAVTFYERLLEGQPIGEAIRQARRELIAKFGPENIIWTSYMLYGDPTTVYCRQEVQKPEQPAAIPPPVPEKTTKSALRGPSERAAKSSTFKFILPAVIVAGLLVFLLLANPWRRQQQETSKTSPAADHQQQNLQAAEEERAKRVDALVDELAKRYRDNQISAAAAGDGWTTDRAVSLVFMEVKNSGVSSTEADYILGRVAEKLMNLGRFQVVERQVLDKLMAELKLSSSALADPATALKLGKVLSARVIATGSMVREKRNWLVSLRFIETETTAIKASLSTMMTGTEMAEIADQLAGKVAEKLRHTYPLQAKISSVDGEKAVINIGSQSGVVKGMRFNVLDERDIPLGQVTVTAVGKTESRIQAGKDAVPLVKGMRLREVQ